jgi:molybdate transport system substrate-binding protein
MAAALENSIRVLSGGAPKQPLSRLIPSFEQAQGVRVDIEYQIVSKLQERVIAGDHPDLILAPAQVIAAIGSFVALVPESFTTIARVGIGVIVRAGAAAPDVSSETAVLAALRAARSIVLADPHTPSGKHLASMLVRLGLAEELRERLIHKGAIHGGGDLVAQGGADIGLFLVSEVQFIDGVQVAGLLPPPLQQEIFYVAAAPASAGSPANALALVRHLAGAASSSVWRDAGFTPG